MEYVGVPAAIYWAWTHRPGADQTLPRKPQVWQQSEDDERARGLPPEGIAPPVEGEVTEGPASRPSEQEKGGKSLWDKKGGEWRYFPGDKYHNPHWDHNPHDSPNSPWENIPIGGLPVLK